MMSGENLGCGLRCGCGRCAALAMFVGEDAWLSYPLGPKARIRNSNGLEALV